MCSQSKHELIKNVEITDTDWLLWTERACCSREMPEPACVCSALVLKLSYLRKRRYGSRVASSLWQQGNCIEVHPLNKRGISWAAEGRAPASQGAVRRPQASPSALESRPRCGSPCHGGRLSRISLQAASLLAINPFSTDFLLLCLLSSQPAKALAVR